MFEGIGIDLGRDLLFFIDNRLKDELVLKVSQVQKDHRDKADQAKKYK